MPIPDFIVQLRQHIGTAQLWLPGVTAVVRRDDAVLLVQRCDNGAWTPVTGIVDPGEHPAAAAQREVLEETGITCRVDTLAWVSVTDPVVHVNGDQAQYLDHTFACTYLGGEPFAADDESLAARFFPLSALPPMRPLYRERIMTALNHAGPTRLS